MDSLDFFAVVKARKLSLIALFVENFYTGDNVGRQIFDGKIYVAFKKFLAVDKNLFHILTLRLNGSAFHHDTRHF